MAILVTGGAGYIGSHMVLALCDAGEEVVVLDDLSTGVRDNVDPRARFVQGDVSDPLIVMRLIAEQLAPAPVETADAVGWSVDALEVVLTSQRWSSARSNAVSCSCFA